MYDKATIDGIKFEILVDNGLLHGAVDSGKRKDGIPSFSIE